METSLEQTLIEVWQQALVENATVVELDGGRFPFGVLPSAACGMWTSCSIATRFADWSRTRTRGRCGRS
jgi:hypothetical protein